MPGGMFLVLAGKHVEPDGQTYEKGEVVKSNKDLDVLFHGKFKRQGGEQRRPRDYDERLNEQGGVMDPPLHKRTEIKKKAAKQAEKMKETLSKPTKKVVTSPSRGMWAKEDDEKEQKKRMARGTGLDIHGDIADEDDVLEDEELPEDEEETGPEEDEEDSEGENDEAEEGEFGTDVSGDFEDARKADLKVFKGDDGYTVVDADEPDTPLHETPFKKASQVNKFFGDYRAGKVDDAAAEKPKGKAMKSKGTKKSK